MPCGVRPNPLKESDWRYPTFVVNYFLICLYKWASSGNPPSCIRISTLEALVTADIEKETPRCTRADSVNLAHKRRKIGSWREGITTTGTAGRGEETKEERERGRRA